MDNTYIADQLGIVFADGAGPIPVHQVLEGFEQTWDGGCCCPAYGVLHEQSAA